ncbi:hypothetical protein ElyMa_002177700, partial [Elysia marginata]
MIERTEKKLIILDTGSEVDSTPVTVPDHPSNWIQNGDQNIQNTTCDCISGQWRARTAETYR